MARNLLEIYEVLAARMRKLITACARKNKRTARMLANARKDHSIPLSLAFLSLCHKLELTSRELHCLLYFTH